MRWQRLLRGRCSCSISSSDLARIGADGAEHEPSPRRCRSPAEAPRPGGLTRVAEVAPPVHGRLIRKLFEPRQSGRRRRFAVGPSSTGTCRRPIHSSIAPRTRQWCRPGENSIKLPRSTPKKSTTWRRPALGPPDRNRQADRWLNAVDREDRQASRSASAPAERELHPLPLQRVREGRAQGGGAAPPDHLTRRVSERTAAQGEYAEHGTAGAQGQADLRGACPARPKGLAPIEAPPPESSSIREKADDLSAPPGFPPPRGKLLVVHEARHVLGNPDAPQTMRTTGSLPAYSSSWP